VVTGSGRTRIFSCPFHKWAYGLDGELLAAPFMDGSEGFDRKKCPLPEVRSQIVEDLGLIFVTFSDTAPPISDRLRDFGRTYANFRLGELAVIRSNSMESAFNWKIQTETFMECYHHIGAHPTTFEVDQPARLSSCGDGKAGWSVCHSPFRPEAPQEAKDSGLPMFPDLEACEREICDYVNIFPNALLAIRADQVSLLVLFPDGPRRTLAQVITLAHRDALLDPAAVEASFARRAEFMALAVKEDNDINELQQSGVTSRLARPGRLSQLETTVWDLANYVRQRVGSLAEERHG
jgi:phenylpropionate dioxygenase-like ring-hydroxylating dioxygenase large terminal subunit